MKGSYRTGPGPWCGTVGGYSNHLCHCEACRAAWNTYHRGYQPGWRARKRASGVTEPRYCTCTGDVRHDPNGMCLDCLRLVESMSA